MAVFLSVSVVTCTWLFSAPTVYIHILLCLVCNVLSTVCLLSDSHLKKMNSLKCRTLGVYNVRVQILERARAIETQVALYAASSSIAFTGAVRMLVLPHLVTTGVSLYIEQEKLDSR